MSERTQHRLFSLARVNAIAGNTLLELIRQKVFYFMVVFALLGIGASFVASGWKFQEQFQVLKDVSLGAMSVFSWLLATLATAMLLPKDMEERTLYTILAKPVSRLEYLLGKLGGVFLLLFIAISLMSVVFAGVLYAREQTALAEALRDYGSGPEGQAAMAEVRQAAFTPALAVAVLVIFMKAMVVATLTLMLSTFATSWIFTVMVSVVIYIVGHVQPIAREYWLASSPDVNPSPLLKMLFGLTAVIFPDFQLFNIVDEIVVGNAVPAWMFAQTFGLGFGYIFIFALVGYVLFAHREL
jgi:hypothetical protein